MSLNTFVPDDDIVETLRKEAVRAYFYADACDKAYREAMQELWFSRVVNKIGRWFNESNPVECVMELDDGPIDVLIVDVEVDYQRKPYVCGKRKLKSGRWGKTVYRYVAPTVIRRLKAKEGRK